MLEFEKKVMLTPEEYALLKEYSRTAAKDIVQINFYYDTDDLAGNRKGVTCRIRETDGICTATVKVHRPNGGECSAEHARPVQDRYDDELFTGRGLSCQGYLKTYRSICTPSAGVKVMLDRSVYLGTTDYELEIEYDRDRESFAREVLNRIASLFVQKGMLTGIGDFSARIGQGGHKSERFFRRRAETERRQP